MKVHYCNIAGHVRLYGDDTEGGSNAYDDRISFIGIVTIQWLNDHEAYVSGGLGKLHIAEICNELANHGATKVVYEHKGKMRSITIRNKDA